jgi:hypothetical protein
MVGGASRRRLSIRQKLDILREWDAAVLEGVSRREFCRQTRIDPHQLRMWEKKRGTLIQSRRTARSVHLGRPSSVRAYEEVLLQWIYDCRCKGIGMQLLTLGWH